MKTKPVNFFSLTSALNSILFDLDSVDKVVTKMEMQYNPKPPKPLRDWSSERKVNVAQDAASQSPPRNFYPPGYPAGSDQIVKGSGDIKGVLKK